jgi:two-component system response regulator PilR (NtrC family)
VRELENVVERSVALEQTPVILADTLPPLVRAGAAGPRRTVKSDAKADADAGATPADATATLPDLPDGFDLEARGEDFYRHYIALALVRAGGVQVKAAEMLGMSFRSFRYYAKKFNVR